MKKFQAFLPLMLLALVAGFSPGAQAAVANDAEVITVRQTCGTTDNCFSSLADAAAWIHAIRHPSASSPLLVDVGPGEFSGFYCAAHGNITVRGSGIGNTRIVPTPGDSTAIRVENCTRLRFEDISIIGVSSGIEWTGGGDSSYVNVELVADGDNVTRAWVDVCDASGVPSRHNFFASTVRSSGTFYNFGYYTECAETWFFGSEIIAIAKAPVGPHVLANGAVRVIGARAQIQAYGSSLRALAGDADVFWTTGPATGLAGAMVQDGGAFHMHGGILTASAAGAAGNNDAATIIASGDALVHVIDTAFNPTASGSGVAHRIQSVGDNRIRSPFLWFSGTNPPAGNNTGGGISSLDGADMFIETDCDASGNCEGAGTETHVMIYNSTCTAAGPWFDSTTGRCRGTP